MMNKEEFELWLSQEMGGIIEDLEKVVYEYFAEKGYTEEQVNELFYYKDQILVEDYRGAPSDEEFYSKTYGYAADLLSWNNSAMFYNLIKDFMYDVYKNKPEKVIDYGGGIGTISLLLSRFDFVKEIGYVDIPGHTMNIAMKAFEKKGITVKTYTPEEYMNESPFYDVLISLDTLEHIENFIPVVEKWCSCSPVIIFNCVWNQDDGRQPMHYEYNTDLQLLMAGYGYIQVGMFTFKYEHDKRIVLRNIINYFEDNIDKLDGLHRRLGGNNADI